MPKTPLPARPLPARPLPAQPPKAGARCGLPRGRSGRPLPAHGGAELYLASGPKRRSSAEAPIGPEAVARMADHSRLGPRGRMPLARRWLAQMRHWQGHSTAEAARTIRASDLSARAWIKKGWG